MSVVNILNIQVLDNPTKFLNPFQFEITFECISPLKEGKFMICYIKIIQVLIKQIWNGKLFTLEVLKTIDTIKSLIQLWSGRFLLELTNLFFR